MDSIAYSFTIMPVFPYVLSTITFNCMLASLVPIYILVYFINEFSMCTVTLLYNCNILCEYGPMLANVDIPLMIIKIVWALNSCSNCVCINICHQYNICSTSFFACCVLYFITSALTYSIYSHSYNFYCEIIMASLFSFVYPRLTTLLVSWSRMPGLLFYIMQRMYKVHGKSRHVML